MSLKIRKNIQRLKRANKWIIITAVGKYYPMPQKQEMSNSYNFIDVNKVLK